MERLIAVSHPGKLGDCLMAFPIARALSRRHGCRVVFHTSEYCRPLERLCRYQSWCHDFVVPPDYVLESLGQGGQPVDMLIDASKYVAVYQAGFRRPPDKPIYVFIRDELHCKELPVEIKYEYPEIKRPAYPYIVMAPRGWTSFWPVFREFAQKSKMQVIEVGGKDEYISDGAAINMCGLDMLETVSLMAHAHAYLGIFSSQLVLADAFRIPRICLHDGIHWNLAVGTQTPYNLYPINPTPEQLVMTTNFLEPASRCYHPDDMAALHGEATSVDEMSGHLAGTYYSYHPARRWEYGLAMQVMKRHGGVKTILDVGGASSILPALAAVPPTASDRAVRIGAEVTIVDPCTGYPEFVPWVREQERRISKSLNLVTKDFLDYDGPPVDCVCCISVIEHVPQDRELFQRLLDHVKPGGLLMLTCDFFPDMVPRAGQCRVYNEECLRILLELACQRGFEPFGGEPDWTYRGPHVESYTFASLVLQRKA